jgi:hypothetical protein
MLAGIGANPPAWVADVTATLQDAYTLRAHATRERYISTLADDRCALILVDEAEWRFWATTPKSSPATRRIPVILVAAQPEAHADALLSGVDRVVTPAEVTRALVEAHARVMSPEALDQLDCECDEPLPALAQQGVEKFNAGAFYKQHDLFEELWMDTEGPVRDLYRAILQVGVAYYQIERGNHRGALKMLLRSVQWLSVLPDVCQGIDVAALREDSYRVRAELERLPEDRIDSFDRSLHQPVKFAS